MGGKQPAQPPSTPQKEGGRESLEQGERAAPNSKGAQTQGALTLILILILMQCYP